MASQLTKKFTTLCSRCSQLLSKQLHYDWGLCAMKSVLAVSGVLRDADSDMSEEAVLMRALRPTFLFYGSDQRPVSGS